MAADEEQKQPRLSESRAVESNTLRPHAIARVKGAGKG
jgi:hypothetical protein